MNIDFICLETKYQLAYRPIKRLMSVTHYYHSFVNICRENMWAVERKLPEFCDQQIIDFDKVEHYRGERGEMTDLNFNDYIQQVVTVLYEKNWIISSLDPDDPGKYDPCNAEDAITIVNYFNSVFSNGFVSMDSGSETEYESEYESDSDLGSYDDLYESETESQG